MKKSDIAVLIVIVAISLGVSYFVGNMIIGSTKQNQTKVETVDKISPTIVEPDAAIFNKDAINPAVPIKIGTSTNQQPFGQ